MNKKIFYTLQVAIAMCFIGHGIFGIITKPIWCNYFGVFGISHDVSYQLMPIVGGFDILCGIMMLAYPMRAIPAWLVIWGAVTALLRPLSGEPFAEFIERAGNYGAPLAFLIFSDVEKNSKGWFTPVASNIKPAEETFTKLAFCLRFFGFLILLGHGCLNLIEKKSLLNQYASLGFSDSQQVAHIIGAVEIAFAIIVLIRPFRSLIFIFFLWKVTSEVFYPQYGLIEWVERGGSYGVLLALWFMTERKTFFKWPESSFTLSKG
jgi:hypothetical protein